MIKIQRCKFNLSMTRIAKMALKLAILTAILIVTLIVILGLCYYQFVYDPNIILLSYHNGLKPQIVGNSTGDWMSIHNNPKATDPSYQQLINFIMVDDTDQIPYHNGSFVCVDYAVRVHDNAENAGIRAGVVSLDFSDGQGHSINVFNTTDRGIVYIDCTGNTSSRSYDKIVTTPVIGSQYEVELLVNSSEYNYESQPWIIIDIHTFY